MTAEILAATEHLVLRRMTNAAAAAALAAYRSDPVQARYQSWETPWIWFRRPRPCAPKTAFETHSAECAALMSVFVRRVERRVTTATD
jgi:hypothetical protein